MVQRVLSALLIAAAVIVGTVALTLWLMQHQLIYHPSGYHQRPPLPETLILEELSLPLAKGKAFLVRSKDSVHLPSRKVWVLFSGNASVALGWLDIIQKWPIEDRAFLLLDYPGYGYMKGNPSRRAIVETFDEAIEAVGRHLGDESFVLEGVVGHSLGAAVALEFAVKRPPERLLLIAPFTSMLDMACLTVGRPFCYLLTERFDNLLRLKELSALERSPSLLVIHGTEDEVIPVKMGRKLHESYAERARYHEVPGGDHVSILWSETDVIGSFIKGH